MAVNKIMINKATGTEVLMDLTSDTVTAETLTNGYTAHDKSGKVVTGTNPYAKAATDATVNTQADLIAQIATALEGKAAGGGGGGGASVETCTVSINNTSGYTLYGAICNRVTDNGIETFWLNTADIGEITNVVKGTGIVIWLDDSMYLTKADIQGGSLIKKHAISNILYLIQTESETVNIRIYRDTSGYA